MGYANKGSVITDCYALAQESIGFCGDKDANAKITDSDCKPAESFRNGEVTWGLNGKSDVEPTWYQFINIDALPTLTENSYAIVHYNGNEYYNEAHYLNDTDTYNASTSETWEKLAYSRSFDNTETWCSYYVPFQMPVNKLNEKGVKVAYPNSILQYDMDEDGVIDRTDLEVIYLKNGTLRASYPYLVKATAEKDVEITLYNVTLQPSSSNTLKLASSIADYNIIGTYAGVSQSEAAANKLMTVGTDNEGKSAIVPADDDIPAQRWYLNIKENDSPVISDGIASASLFRIVVVGEEDLVTGIRTMYSVPIVEGVYDLSGRRLTQPHKGINIINGKKIIVK